MRARGLKHHHRVREGGEQEVAPHAGAWVETSVLIADKDNFMSRPMRARGLKLYHVF